MTTTTGLDQCFQYAKCINDGEIKSNRFIKAAIKRFYSDYEKIPQDDYPFYFCEHTANKFCKFFTLLNLTKGVPHGTKFNLEPWQCFIICNIFGWLRKDNGKRRFKEAYIEVPKKNGKTTLMSGIALATFLIDNEARPDVYVSAYTADQASICFKEAKAMVQNFLLRERAICDPPWTRSVSTLRRQFVSPGPGG